MSRRVSAVAPARVLGKTTRLSIAGPVYVPPGVPNGSKPGLLQRRASFHGGKSSQPRTDPRPINDRGFQQECIRTLTGYLMTHGYNVTISTKLLVSPASKDILNIVQFLFQKADPNMKLSGKMEEDVPVVFKRLGYPFQISKSALYAAGSPHTWPGLLAALVWFVDLLLHQESAEAAESFDNAGPRSAFENLSQSYQCFLAGDDDDCERLNSAFRQQFEDQNGELMEKLAKLQGKVTEAEEHLHRLSTEKSPLVSLEAKKADFLSDKQKFIQINSSLQWHKQAAEKKLDERKEDLLAKKAEKKAIQADIEELRRRIAAQEINLAEVERMQKEENLLEVNIQPIASKEQQLRKAAWEHELGSTNKTKDLEILCAEYNEHCQRLRPTLAEGQPLSGVQLQITLQSEKNVPLEILGTSVPGGLKAALLEVIESCKRHTEQERKETMACKQEVYAREATRQEKLDLMSQRNATIKKVEALYKASKDKWDVEVAAVVHEREELEAKVAAKEAAAKRTDADADELVKHWEQKYEAESASCAKQLASARKEWLEVVDHILSAKEHMRELLGNLKTKTHAEAERVKHDLSELLPSIRALQV
jgi:kinetochore protein NDC80